MNSSKPKDSRSNAPGSNNDAIQVEASSRTPRSASLGSGASGQRTNDTALDLARATRPSEPLRLSSIVLSSDIDDEHAPSSSDHEAQSDSSSDSSSSVSIQSYRSPSPELSSPRQPSRPQLERKSLVNPDGAISSPTAGIPPNNPVWSTSAHDYPLPRPTFEFDPLNYAPLRDPMKPARYVPEEERELGEAFERLEMKRGEESKERLRDQAILREDKLGEERWTRTWQNVNWERQAANPTSTNPDILRSASFFPYPQLEGLEWLEDVFVTVGGDHIDFYRCKAASTSKTSLQLIRRVQHSSSPPLQEGSREQYFTCAWSVNTTTWPFTPILAVAGEGRVIEVYLVGVKHTKLGGTNESELVVHLDRTMTGHGGPIHSLAFHPERPHLLLSCSDDRTIRLWDPTLPWGSDAEVRKVVEKEMSERIAKGRLPKKRKHAQTSSRKGKSKEHLLREPKTWTRMRPRVDGELVALLTGHLQSVFTADFHPLHPLVVSGGADGRIKLWHLPRSTFDATPPWPTPPHLYRHPAPHTELVHPPVIEALFSTILLHPGQWPAQVSFLDGPVPTIVSMAPLTSSTGAITPRTSIKIWTVDCLSTLPNRAFDSHLSSHDLSRTRTRRKTGNEDREAVDPVPLKPTVPEGESEDLGFRIEKEIVLEGLNCCIGDRIGIYRHGPFRFDSGDVTEDGENASEGFLAVPTTKLADGYASDAEKEAAGLYLFRPFSAFGTLPCATSNRVGNKSVEFAKEERIAKLFPPDRERPLHDFHPRLRPSSILEYPDTQGSRGSTEEERANGERTRGDLIHFRCVAISPGTGEWIIGVGDEGLIASWRSGSVGGQKARSNLIFS